MKSEDKLMYPIPKEKLLARFGPIFKKLSEGYSATLLALPHTGRTSHLRFISSQTSLLKELGITEKHLVCFIEVDKTPTFEAFLFEIREVLLAHTPNKNISGISTDSYLLANELIKICSQISKERKLIFVVTIKERVLTFSGEIDTLFVQIQKGAANHPVTLLWSFDTHTFRNYSPGHLSSTVHDNIFYFPTFDKKETDHSIRRFARIKGKIFKKDSLSNSLSETGGIAAFFHDFVNKEAGNTIPNTLLQKVVDDLKSEIEINKTSITNLATSFALDFVKQKSVTSIGLGDITFRTNPVAQEILLIQRLTKDVNTPVSRDDIAQILWGKAWQNKYSDWAIDKAISRLRKNIATPQYRLITIKNLGYQLIKL